MKKYMKIVILDAYSTNPGDLSWDGFKEFGQLEIYERTHPNEIVSRCLDAECVLTNKVVFDSNIISQLPNLKYIGVLATGYNVVDIKAAAEHGIIVTNIPSYSTDSVVQMTFAHILNITNRVGDYANANRKGKWSSNVDFCYWDSPLHEIAGKTIGIIGLGKIGMRVAKLARCFGMDVFAITSKHAADLPDGIQKTTLDGLFGVSDIITLHCPLTEKTHGMINSKALAKMKPGAILINTGRGPLVNENDVAEALKSGHLGAYGTDVMCCEPPSADNLLFDAPNAFVTPHIAWATVEARIRLISIAVDNVKAFVNGKPINTIHP